MFSFAWSLNFWACLAILASYLSFIAIFSRSCCCRICSSSLINIYPSLSSNVYKCYSFYLGLDLITALSPDFDLDLDLDLDLDFDFWFVWRLLILRYFWFSYEASCLFNPTLSPFNIFLYFKIGDLLSNEYYWKLPEL